jgi:aspartate racemase
LRPRKHIYGVIGGMGPQASAEFLKTIYEHCLGEREQEFPVVMVYSDPSFPDRTEAFLRGEERAVLDQLIKGLLGLRVLGVTKVALCCMTIHHLLPRLPPDLREAIVSLPDVVFDSVASERRRYLLICSTGARALRIFELHPRWPEMQDCFILPSDEDQQRIHLEIIFQIKRNPDPRPLVPLLDHFMEKYETNCFIAGCSEIHLFAKHFARTGNNTLGYYCIDPLTILAEKWAAE